MRSDNILIHLSDDMKKASKVHVSYTISEKEIIDGCVMRRLSKDNIYMNYNEYIENNCIFNLDNLEILDEGLNCDVCCAYTLIEEVRNKIKGYVDSVIVLSKINSFVYKIDANMEQIDIITKMSYETNMQCIITIYNDH